MIQIAPVQHVELAEADAAGAHLFHRRLVFVAPRIGQCIGLVGAHAKVRAQLSCHATAPIDERAEDVEDQRAEVHLPLALRQASNAILLASSVGGYRPRID